MRVLSLVCSILRSKFFWVFTPIAALGMWVWITQYPLVRTAYGSLTLPLRALQYAMDPLRSVAGDIANQVGEKQDKGVAAAYLERHGIWSVLAGARAAKLPLVEQALAVALVKQESGFSYLAKNKRSSACGLYQFIKTTGEQYELPWWSCMDPLGNAKAGAYSMMDYRKLPAMKAINIKAKGGFRASGRCLYLMHFYGPNNGCSKDRLGVWPKVSKRFVKTATSSLTILRRYERESQTWFWAKTVLVVLLLIVLFFSAWICNGLTTRALPRRA